MSGGLTVEEAGTQTIIQHELALFLQDSWKPNRKLTVNYGLRWEAQIEPILITPLDQLFYAPFIGQTVTNSVGTFEFPGDGTIPSDYKMFQPRLGIAYDAKGDGKQVFRANAGLYYARIPGLNLARSRSTDGSRRTNAVHGQLTDRRLGRAARVRRSAPSPAGGPFFPGVFVFDKNFQNPRTFSAPLGYEWRGMGAAWLRRLSYTHAAPITSRDSSIATTPCSAARGARASTIPGRDDQRRRHADRQLRSSAKSRYNGVTAELKRRDRPNFQFQVNYTLSWDKSDDDNERDPFTFRYAQADSLDPEYNWSDRDQRHRFNGWVLDTSPGDCS